MFIHIQTCTHTFFIYNNININFYLYPYIGTRIAIYWEDDDKWYNGAIIAYDPESERHSIFYEDRTIEHVHLIDEKFKIVS